MYHLFYYTVHPCTNFNHSYSLSSLSILFHRISNCFHNFKKCQSSNTFENFFLSDVTRKCFHDGKEYNVGDITRSADGCKTCTCLESGSMQCANTQCNNNGKSIHIVSSMFYFNSSLIIMDWFLKLFILFLLGGGRILISWSSITHIF